MNHVAVDLGSRKSQICVRAADGQVLKEARIETRALEKFFGHLETSRVVLETCAEAFAVADFAVAAGHTVNVVPATLAPSLGVGQRGIKTDRRDAQNLSLTSCRMEELPNVHRPTVVTRDRRAMMSHRQTLVSARTGLINSVKGWARSQLIQTPGSTSETFPTRIREAAMEQPAGLPSYISRTLEVLEELNKQLKEADKELKALAEEDETCRRLMTMPGVGPVTAMSFRAALDDVSRFKSAHAVEAYLGLTPGESSSGEKKNRQGITKAGPTRVRTALVQAAWCAFRTKPEEPMVQWAKRLSERKKPQVAICALARKMAGILYAMWRDGTTYDSSYQP